MKTMKRFFASMVATMMMVAMLVVSATAATGTYKVTINGTSASHTYEAYQIFAGSVTVNNGNLILSSIDWGDGVDSTNSVDGLTLLDAVKAISYNDGSTTTTPFDSCTNAQSVAGELAKYSNNGAIANMFAATVGKYLTNFSGTSALTSGTTYTISNLAAGYYLIRDQNGTVPDAENQLYTKYLITVVGDSTVTVKGNFPTVTKTVHTSATGTFKNAEDASIGDTVFFKLSGFIPANYADYSQYFYQFTDELPDGLDVMPHDYNNDSTSEQVYVYVLHSDDSEVEIPSSSYTVNYDEENHVLTITIDDLKDLDQEIHTDDSIIVKYAAKLNSAVVLGKVDDATQGNRNSVKLTYSNDPNQVATTPANAIHKGTTTAATASVYTYQLNVTKIDSDDNNKELSGAQFLLYKTTTGGSQYAIVEGGKLTGWGNKASGTTLTTTDGVFSIAGLDTGTYYLEETKAPDGYNKLLAPVQVTIAATYSGQDVTVLTVEVGDGIPANGDISTGIVGISVENKSGTTLPSTGGMGTTIFYIAGATLMIGAAAVLITKKRGAQN